MIGNQGKASRIWTVFKSDSSENLHFLRCGKEFKGLLRKSKAAEFTYTTYLKTVKELFIV
ncbi:hypothetical protein CER18_00680 [Bartonella tribocorum]|uniref:Uncharacterized protein n=1 Tax=Bartonella tribocorum TaxID=85701 RepID=A0A2M6UVN9_9HYPH|nr:hypothetical protein CER18_00680 [Bartonella tribocorum]